MEIEAEIITSRLHIPKITFFEQIKMIGSNRFFGSIWIQRDLRFFSIQLNFAIFRIYLNPNIFPRERTQLEILIVKFKKLQKFFKNMHNFRSQISSYDSVLE